jgi:AraC-like DNA-binding protein
MATRPYGFRLGEYFGLDAPPTISAQLLQTAEFAATRLHWGQRLEPEMVRIDTEDAFLLFMLRRGLPGNPYWIDGRQAEQGPRLPGQFNFLDLHHEHVAEIQSGVDCVAMYVPRVALEILATEQTLRWTPPNGMISGHAIDDSVIWHLSESLVPVLERPGEANPLFVEHIGMALAWRLIHHYGELSPLGPPHPGGLAPWQERRAQDMLMASITGQVSLSELAAACRLSRSHFARAFKATTGLAPHQWLLTERVRLARFLLESTARTIAEIAEDCGFADQSHFSRVFARFLSCSPGRWRRERQQ